MTKKNNGLYGNILALERYFMEKKKKIVIGLASVSAGGGHNALRDFLYQELQNDGRFKCYSFTHSNTSLDKANDYVWPNLGRAFDILYNTFPNEYVSISSIQLVKECEKFIKEYNPDIVIATYLGISAAFKIVKRSLKLNFIIINAIPDYGIPSDAYLPNRYLKPDFMMVFDEVAKNGIALKYRFPKEKMLLSGYLANKTFQGYIKEARTKSREDLVKEIQNELGRNYKIIISPKKRTLIVTGGSGGVVNKSFGLLSEIVKYQKSNPTFKEQNQIVIITGRNVNFYKKILKFHQKKKLEWNNIIPIPWIDHKTYSKLQYLSEFPIMESIAPASMNEMIESECGPLLIHNSRRGPETANVKFVLNNKLGVYLPKKKEALKLIINGFSKKEKEEYVERIKKYREVRLNRIKNLADDITEVYNKYSSSKRKSDKQRLKMKFDWSLISPKVWITIALLMLPLTLIVGFVEYSKQKNKITESRLFKLLNKDITELI